jgi:four helix bundle protein
MKENIIKSKSFAFALRVVKLYQYLTEIKNEYVLSKQLLRSGTAIGALVREAEHAESKADFIHKLSISLKEANETEYWLELLQQSGYLDENTGESFNAEIKEILQLLISIIKSSKELAIDN